MWIRVNVSAEDYASLCSSFSAPVFPERFPEPAGSETGAGRGGASGKTIMNNIFSAVLFGDVAQSSVSSGPPYRPDFFPPQLTPSRDFGRPDYDDYSPAGGSRSTFRGRTPAFGLPDETYQGPEFRCGLKFLSWTVLIMSRNGNRWFLSLSTSYYSEGDYGSPDSPHPRTPSVRLPPDSRSELGFGTRPDLPSLNLAPLPGSPYEVQEEEEEDERTWRPGPRFPSFTDRSRGGAGGGGAPRRVYESEFVKTKNNYNQIRNQDRSLFPKISGVYFQQKQKEKEFSRVRLLGRYDTYAGLNAAEDCGILHGCDNGRCIRVAEGYTCDCYQGYKLDMTSMTCVGTSPELRR